jgi:hypothetical protein
MTPPKDLDADLTDLESDAGTWSTAGDEMGLAHDAAADLVLGEAQFGWVAAERGVVASYEAVQAKLVALLDGARQEFDRIETELRDTAASYGRGEATNVDRVHGLDEQRQGTIQDHQQDKGRING